MKQQFTRVLFATLLWLVPYQAFSQTETLQYLGIGPHVLRANVGLRLRVN
jgi:hypothetical protein